MFQLNLTASSWSIWQPQPQISRNWNPFDCFFCPSGDVVAVAVAFVCLNPWWGSKALAKINTKTGDTKAREIAHTHTYDHAHIHAHAHAYRLTHRLNMSRVRVEPGPSTLIWRQMMWRHPRRCCLDSSIRSVRCAFVAASTVPSNGICCTECPVRATRWMNQKIAKQLRIVGERCGKLCSQRGPQTPGMRMQTHTNLYTHKHYHKYTYVHTNT